MIFGEHTLGVDGDLTVAGSSNTIHALMTIEIVNGDGAGGADRCFEWLSRSDIERLRDLCDEALS